MLVWLLWSHCCKLRVSPPPRAYILALGMHEPLKQKILTPPQIFTKTGGGVPFRFWKTSLRSFFNSDIRNGGGINLTRTFTSQIELKRIAGLHNFDLSPPPNTQLSYDCIKQVIKLLYTGSLISCALLDSWLLFLCRLGLAQVFLLLLDNQQTISLVENNLSG